MKTGRIREIAESYINGNISDTKKSLQRMSKLDLLEWIDCMAQYYYQSLEDGQGNKLDGYMQAVSAATRLLTN